MIIDAHQHFWRLDRGDHDFPRRDDRLLYRDFLPDALQDELGRAGVAQTVAVQAAETIAETEYLLTLAVRTPFIAGVVGWCDLAAGAAARGRLVALQGQGPLVGIRPMLQRRDDAGLAAGSRHRARPWLQWSNWAWPSMPWWTFATST